MNDQKDVNKPIEQSSYVDPRTVEAEVLGELRKTKIGKPWMVLQMLAFMLLVLIGLPIINNMLNDENSFLYKLFNSSGGVTPVITNPVAEFLDGGVGQPLTSATVMKFDNIVMKNFSLSNGTIRCTMYSYNGLLNLDEEEYYFLIYANSDGEDDKDQNDYINYIKLTGTHDYQEKVVNFTSEHMNFNNTVSYFGKIILKESSTYPEVNMTVNELGIGSFSCRKGTRTIQYSFKNNYLVGIKDTDRVLLESFGEDTQGYVNMLAEYRAKATKLGAVANVEEVTDGFLFTSDVNLEAPGFVIPTDLGDYNYYKLDTEAKIVHYAMVGKGYDCE